MARGLLTELYVPVVTTILKQMIMGFQSPGGHSSAGNLTTDCQPFMVAYAGKAHHLHVTTASSVANQLAQGEHNASLADNCTIREGEKIKFPSMLQRCASHCFNMLCSVRASSKVWARVTLFALVVECGCRVAKHLLICDRPVQ